MNKLKSIRRAFKAQSIELQLDAVGHPVLSGKPQVGKSVVWDDGKTPEDGRIHLRDLDVLVTIQNGQITNVEKVSELGNRKAFKS